MNKSLRLAEIAKAIGAELKGDGNCLISGIAPLSTALAGQLSFLDNPRYRKFLSTTQASAVILKPDDAVDCPSYALITSNPYLGYAKAATLFEHRPPFAPGIDATAVIGQNCTISATASVGPYCIIGDEVSLADGVIIEAGCMIAAGTQIAADTHLYPRVSLYHQVHIGRRGIIHSGVVIGSDGFGIAPDQGRWHKIPQLGRVIIGDDVEIGANTTIDRGALDDTIIGHGVKLDNQIQIGHNVKIGDHTVIAACTGIAGSTEIGKHCIIGGGTGIAGHLQIADHVMITGMAMVTTSINEAGTYSSGTGLMPNHAWQKNVVRFRQLDDLAKRVRSLEKQLANNPNFSER